MITDERQHDVPESDAAPVAELLNRLFATRRRPDGKEYTNREVAETLGQAVTASYLSKLRRGEVKNPSRNALKQLCLFFRVPAAYFFPELVTLAPRDDNAGQQQLELALRAYGIPEDMHTHVEALLKALRKDTRPSDE